MSTPKIDAFSLAKGWHQADNPIPEEFVDFNEEMTTAGFDQTFDSVGLDFCESVVIYQRGNSEWLVHFNTSDYWRSVYVSDFGSLMEMYRLYVKPFIGIRTPSLLDDIRKEIIEALKDSSAD